MAHVGKAYKVWFRRDASLNRRNNNDSLPECFIGKFKTFGGPVGAALNACEFKLINLTKSIMPAIWTSEPTYSMGYYFTCQFAWTDNPNDGFDKADIKVTRGVSTKVVEGKSIEANDVGIYNVHNAECGPGTFTLGPSITAPFGGFTLDMRAAHWAEYNP